VTYVQIITTGILLGGVYAISGLGLVLTYKATGVFNLAHFTIALLAAYVLWQFNGVWGISLWIAAPFVLLVVGPGIGVVLERFVFRSLQRRRASTSEKLVANLGLVVLILGLINIVWGPGVKGNVHEPVPRLWPDHQFHVAGVRFDSLQLAYFVAALLSGLALYALLRHTFLGTKIQAVVDRRELAELSTIDANRVSMVAWAIGCGLAGLTGVLLAPPVLEPNKIVLFGIEMLSVAIVARLVSLPLALLSGLLLLGGLKDLLVSFHPFGNSGFWSHQYSQLTLNFSVVVLFVFLLAYRRLDEVGESAPTGQGLVATDLGRRRRGGPSPASVALVLVVGIAALALPALLSDINLAYGQQMVAYVVIFASIVAITGFSGHITLGQASIAGLGAFFTARGVNGLHLPVIAAMVFGAGVAMIAGLVAGYPALRRKGLFLGLTTLSLGLLIDRFVFNNESFMGGPSGLVVKRPSLFGASLTSNVAFYYFELAVAVLMLLFAANLRSGRLGRILGAMRDSETAAKAIGIDLRRYKLFIFAASSFIAGIGGALLSQSQGAWDVNTYNPLFSLFWFVAVTVAGISTLSGAVLAAFIYVLLPLALDQDIESAVFFLGVGALFLGQLPGGLVGLVRRLPARLNVAISKEYQRARREQSTARGARRKPSVPAFRPSAFAQSLLDGQQTRAEVRS